MPGKHGTTEERFWSKVNKHGPGGCWLWTGRLVRDGYGHLVVEKRQERAHRASWIINRGPIPEGLHVLHKCDVPSCVNPDHLFLGTNADNMADRNLKGRQTRGSRHYLAKLNEEQVREIRRRPTESLTALGREFGTTRQAIYLVRSRKNWKHV